MLSKAKLDSLTRTSLPSDMIRSFKNRALTNFWHDGNAARIRPDLIRRIKTRLDALNAARVPEDMN